MEPTEAASSDLAKLLTYTIFKWANKRIDAVADHRVITLEVFESVALTIAAVIGSTVSPENIQIAVPLVLQHINTIVMMGVVQASRATQEVRKKIAQNARLEELWNKDSSSDGKVS